MTATSAFRIVFLPRTLSEHPQLAVFQQTVAAMGATVAWLADKGELGLSRVQCSLYDAKVEPEETFVAIDQGDDLRDAGLLMGLAVVGIITGAETGALTSLMAHAKPVAKDLNAVLAHLALR